MQNYWGIIGGGFGMYGYLPAISQNSNSDILVLKKNYNILLNRPELKKYINNVKCVDSYEELIQKSTSLVISTPPKIQEKYISLINSKGYRYKNLVLEKPIASNPFNAENILALSIKNAESVRVGYSFNDTYWAKSILNKSNFFYGESRDILWRFYAHHFRNKIDSWKSSHEMGGGVLRFYGIQLIALIVLINKEVTFIDSNIFYGEKDKPFKWIAKFQLIDGGTINIHIDSRSQKEEFKIWDLGEEIKLTSPFDVLIGSTEDDFRVPIIKKFIDMNPLENNKYYKYYSDVNSLWLKMELNTKWNFVSE